MAELAVVIIVGCCPYVPRFLRSVQSRGSGSNDANEKHFSIPSKPAAKLNTFDKYLSSRSGMTKLEPTISEEDLEMHQYRDAEPPNRGSFTDEGVQGKCKLIVAMTKLH